MGPDFLDRWSRLDSPVHRAPAALKLALCLGIVLLTAVPAATPRLFLALGLFLLGAALASRVPARFLLGRLLLLEPLALGAVLLAALGPGGSAAAAVILARSTLCLAALVLLTSTTPFAGILGVLRRLRVPALMITVLALLYRYLFVLADEALRMQRARSSRSFAPGRARSWLSLAGLLGQLFVRSTERAERIHAAMCARGWR